MEADFVDVGVGFAQCGPYHCDNCDASEISPERDRGKTECINGEWKYVQIYTQEEIDTKLKLDEDERRTGFYKGRISPLAN